MNLVRPVFLSLLASVLAVANTQPPPPLPQKDEPQKGPEPSRYVAGEELESYVAAVAASLAIMTRNNDPFGKPQDPARAVVEPEASPSAPVVPTQPLSEIIALIRITTVMPGEKRFLIGSRSISQGQVLPLNYRGRLIRVQVTEVNSRQIDFKNLETGEVATHRLDLLPSGMTAGSEHAPAPGMTPAGRDAPLELDGPSAPSTPHGSPRR